MTEVIEWKTIFIWALFNWEVVHGHRTVMKWNMVEPSFIYKSSNSCYFHHVWTTLSSCRQFNRLRLEAAMLTGTKKREYISCVLAYRHLLPVKCQIFNFYFLSSQTELLSPDSPTPKSFGTLHQNFWVVSHFIATKSCPTIIHHTILSF